MRPVLTIACATLLLTCGLAVAQLPLQLPGSNAEPAAPAAPGATPSPPNPSLPADQVLPPPGLPPPSQGVAPDQTVAPTPTAVPIQANPGLRIDWEVKNRFRLFRSEADFQRQVAAYHGDGVLAAEDRLEQESDGRGWARGVLGRLCVDGNGKLLESCDRDGTRETYLSPTDHRIGVLLGGTVPTAATCAWSFDDGEGQPQQANVPCEEEVRLRVRSGRPTIATATLALPDGTAQQVTTQIVVRDVLIAGMGDSIAAGEGNPDRPVALDDGGFCFRRFLGGGRSEYFRPGRAGYKGDKACENTTPNPDSARDWQRHGARWLSAACHRSLYSYQTRTALELAVENPHLAVTYIPLGCSGATVEEGLLGTQRARECNPGTVRCSTSVPSQVSQLKSALALAQKQNPARKLDLILLTVGANDIYFSGLIADVIVQAGTERTLFEQNNIIASVDDARDVLTSELPQRFARLRAALKPLVGGNLARVVFVSYGNPALQAEGLPCPGGRDGFDVHPAFSADPQRLSQVATFVSKEFVPRLKALARCEDGVICRDPSNERMTFVDGHQAAFAAHGFCARSQNDPPFDRECFSAKGTSFDTSKVAAAEDPLACGANASDFRPYAPRARWIRTANDSYFTAMTYPEDLPASLKPSDIHDATWGVASAVYGGAIHPTAEGHAAMADATLPAVRGLLGITPPAEVQAEPLPPPQGETTSQDAPTPQGTVGPQPIAPR